VSGFLRFLAFFALLVAVLVLIVLPLALSPLLTQMVRDMGLRSTTLDVSVAPFDPLLLIGKSRRINLVADQVEMDPARVGRVELALENASYFDRSFESVDGSFSDVSVAVGDGALQASEIAINGPAESATATARMTADQAEQMVRVAAARAGVPIDDVRLTDSGVRVDLRGRQAQAGLRVAGGALLLEPDIGGSIVLLQPAPSDPWQLEEAWVSDGGLNLRGQVDVAELVVSLTR
jgi:hypothetical protein